MHASATTAHLDLPHRHEPLFHERTGLDTLCFAGGVALNWVVNGRMATESPFDHLYALPVFLQHLKPRFPNPPVFVSPDAGGVERTRAYAKRLGADLAIIDKRRPRANVATVMNIIGDVEGRSCILVDDLVDTAGTLCKAAKALKEHGAAKVVAYCTHPVLSGPAVTNIESSQLDELVVTNTIPLREEAASCSKIRPLSIAGLLAESIRRINNEESVSSLFVD